MTSINKKSSSQTIVEHKQVFGELEDLYSYKKMELIEYSARLPYGWTWWSLPPKMWRIAKALGFENDELNHKWVYYNTISGYGDYTVSKTAQESALDKLQKKYPDSILLQNISSGGRLD